MKTTTQSELQELKARMEELETTMVHTYTQQRDRNREMFEISKRLEELEDPESYEQNKAHWGGHQIRF